MTGELTRSTTSNDLQELTVLLEKSYAGNTLTAYKNDQRIFIELTNKNLLQATSIDVMDYIKGLSSKGYAPSTTARKIHSISRQIWILVRAGLRADNPIPLLKSLNKNLIPKQVRRIHQSLTRADIAQIKALEGNKTALLIELLYSTGGRISEILSIKNQDIKACDEMVSRVGILGKGNKSRVLFIKNDLIERIYRVFNPENEYLIHATRGKQAHRGTEHRNIKALIKKVTGKDAHPHQLRHLYATTQIVENKESVKAVSKYLGHSTTAITQDMYVDDQLTSTSAVLE